MPEADDLPPEQRARLARALEAAPLRRPQPWQARYARVARHLREPGRRRPTLALLTGAVAMVALTMLAASVTTDVDPWTWPGRALTGVRDTLLPQLDPDPNDRPTPEATVSTPGRPPAAAPTDELPTPAPSQSASPPAGVRPRLPLPPLATPPIVVPGGLTLPSPLPTIWIPTHASDIHRRGR